MQPEAEETRRPDDPEQCNTLLHPLPHAGRIHRGGQVGLKLRAAQGAGPQAGQVAGLLVQYHTAATALTSLNEMMKRGASRLTMEAKIFGGGAVISGMNSINVGERNTKFVTDFLATERIPIVSKDVLDIYPRKVCFLPASGKAMVKRLAPTNPEAIAQQERLAPMHLHLSR